jgi:V/A-type H+/Na+-transporting ATPase subunit I
MMNPEKMSKLFVLGPKSRLHNVVSSLHSLKVAHFIEHKKGKYDLCTPLQSFEKVGSLLVQVRSMMIHLDISGTANLKEFELQNLDKEIREIKEEVSKINGKIKVLEDEKLLISQQENTLKLMAGMELKPEYFKKSNYIKSYFGHVNDPKIKEKLNDITDRFEIYSEENDKRFLVAIFADSKFAEKFDKILSDSSFSEIDISTVKDLKGDPTALFKSVVHKNAKLAGDLGTLKEKLRGMGKKNRSFLLEAEKFLSVESEKAQAPLGFGSTKETFFLECYLPEKNLEKVKGEITNATNNSAHFIEEGLGNEDEIPIKLNNPTHVKPFEFFTNLYALPKYKEFDPTSLIAYTFPLFYGFMLGDVVYGLLVFALFYFLCKKVPAGKDFFTTMMAAGISAVIFGAIFGEVMGFEPYQGLIVRTHDFNALMAIALITGIVHVNFGLLLGFILEYKHHGLFAAITHKFSWVLIQIGGTLFIGPLLGMLTFASKTPFYIGIIIFIIGVWLLFKAEGAIGVMELPTIISHILSYARLMAVGLASVFIAVMVNQFAAFLFTKNVFLMPLAVIAFITGHVFAIALGILSPSLHSIRLHYVEFFTKFYSGGGQEYRPFGAEKEKGLL